MTLPFAADVLSSFCIPHSDFCILAQQSFPRGPGFYFSPLKLLAIIAVYLIWVRTTWWVDHDCKELELPTIRWNPIMLASGLLGLLLVAAVPIFLASFVALLALFLAPALLYVGVRNNLVSDEQKVLTPRHLKKVARRLLGLGGRDVEEKKKFIPIRFVGKSFDGKDEDATRVRRAAESPHYRAALQLVYDAVLARATDIHLEPTKDEMTVRFRIDGILQATSPFGREVGDAVLNIFKVLSAMDITEKRKPQDGSFSGEAQTQESGITLSRILDFRVATSGSVAGEKMVIRILDRSRTINDLARLGMRERMREQIHTVVSQPHGMFIVCGPTGAGKSTTLYACMAQIDRFQKNVITVENPVEYHIDHVTQIEINPKAGKTFATELRSILRQDPDVIYIGEIRDQETAEIACQAAQTGHMVFTTLHANDTPTAIIRLLDLGVQPYMVASALSAILGQRLVRMLCPQCKVAYRPNPDLLRRANLPAGKIKAFYRPPKEEEIENDDEGNPKVCEHCGGTGYRGRTGIFELLVVTDKIREMIKENLNLDQIRQEAVKQGMVYLQQDGMRVVIEGETSVDELLRVAK